MTEQPSLLADVKEFVELHCPHGDLQSKAGAHTERVSLGSGLSKPRRVRAVFRDDAAIDMALLARWN